MITLLTHTPPVTLDAECYQINKDCLLLKMSTSFFQTLVTFPSISFCIFSPPTLPSLRIRWRTMSRKYSYISITVKTNSFLLWKPFEVDQILKILKGTFWFLPTDPPKTDAPSCTLSEITVPKGFLMGALYISVAPGHRRLLCHSFMI